MELNGSQKNWGAEREQFLWLYSTLVQSRIDNGAAVYSSACKSVLRLFDVIHYSEIWYATGAFRKSNAESLGQEVSEESYFQFLKQSPSPMLCKYSVSTLKA